MSIPASVVREAISTLHKLKAKKYKQQTPRQGGGTEPRSRSLSLASSAWAAATSEHGRLQATAGPDSALSRLVAVRLLLLALSTTTRGFLLDELARLCRRNCHTLRMLRRPCPTMSSRCFHFAFCHAGTTRLAASRLEVLTVLLGLPGPPASVS